MSYKLLSLKEAKDNKHKYVVMLLDTTTNKKYKISFGAFGMNDYTLYSKNDDPEKERHKRNYLNRHRKNEDWNDIKSAGFWSRWILWSKPSVEESLKHTIKKFNIKISD
jgi:hypothetical protein